MRAKHLLSIKDLSRKECQRIVKGKFKKSKGNAILFFQLPSTRTRSAFELGLKEMGMVTEYVDARTTHLNRGETIQDTARVLSSYCDVIVARIQEHDTLLEFASASEATVVNALTNLEHPTQALNDFYTIEKEIGLKNARIAWVGDGTNVCNSIVLLSEKMGVPLKVSTPRGYEPAYECDWTEDPEEAVEGANVIMTDAWVSMGQEKQAKKKLKALKEYQVNKKLLEHASPDWVFMHCLPAHRGQEVTGEVIDGPRSLVWEQAKNKKKTAKAVVSELLQNRGKRL